MGGSRCTYRNCTVRSDGVVHLFHYPVYDKIRCHQWLVNAHRLDFLNLKLSQVRNRVVCQHHFKDDCFMNYKKEKLTYYAVPTEDGPYCNSSDKNALSSEQIAKAYSIVLTDIDENDKYSKISSRNNNSMTYADFLTNGDMWEKKSLNETIWNNMVVTDEETKPAEGKKKSVVWYNIDKSPQKDESQKSLISLADLIGDTHNTKISEFENPLLANMNIDENNYNVSKNEDVKFYKKINDVKKKNDVDNQDFKNLLINQQPNNVALTQDQIFAFQDQNLNNVLLNRENDNTLINFNNYVGPSTNVNLEKTYDSEITVNQDVQTENENRISDTSHPALITDSNFFAIIENPNSKPQLVMQAECDKTLSNQEMLQNNITIDRYNVRQNQNSLNVTKKPKVQILSEKTISDPVVVKGILEPVSPSIFIHVPKKKNNKYVPKEEKPEDNNTIECEKKTPIEINVPVKDEVLKFENSNTTEINRNVKSNDVIPKTPVIKHKIAPERVAAIEKKRNFNKKLRDIIETCLDKLDDQDNKPIEDIKITNSMKLMEKQKVKSQNPNVGLYLSKQAELPNEHKFIMTFLEAKMKTMQDVLLNKIQENSQRILELKNSVPHNTTLNIAKGTQTYHNEEFTKKQLYQQISKYLSPSTNSLIYEELFINKYDPEIKNESSLPKRRKRR